MPWLKGQGIPGKCAESDNLGVDWVLRWDFGNHNQNQAIAEFRTLIEDLHDASLRVQVRRGDNATLLIFIHVPRNHLGQMIQKSRIQDWLFGITHTLPVGDENAIAAADTPAEEIRSVYDAITSPKEAGGAGIVPTCGKWENITASFPLHDPEAYSLILRRWTHRFVWSTEDLDAVRAIFGEKVAFYCAFTHCYSFFLFVPAIMGVIAWLHLSPSPIIYGSLLSIWSAVFVEYWKIREADLSLRWGVKGVQRIKQNQMHHHEGQAIRSSIPRNQILTQMMLLPIALVAGVALASLVCATLAGETFLSQMFHGPLQDYVDWLPTILLSFLLALITSPLKTIATFLSDYEGHLTQESYSVALSQKTGLLNFITPHLMAITTASVYRPLNKSIFLYLGTLPSHQHESIAQARAYGGFARDSVWFAHILCFFVAAQVPNFCKRRIYPYIKRQMRSQQPAYQQHVDSQARDGLEFNPPNETSFLRRVFNEADADEYKFDDETLGNYALFSCITLLSAVYPLVPLAIFVINWRNLREAFSFSKLTNCQRTPPVRAESTGPYLQEFDFLSRLGTVSTALILYMHHWPDSKTDPYFLLLTMLIAYQAHLVIRFTVATILRKTLTDPLAQETTLLYNARKNLFEAIHTHPGSPGSPGSPGMRARRRVRFNERVNVYNSSVTPSSSADTSPSSDTEQLREELLKGSDREFEFWKWGSGDPADDGMQFIKTSGVWGDGQME